MTDLVFALVTTANVVWLLHRVKKLEKFIDNLNVPAIWKRDGK